MSRVAIIGAGIGGATLAHRLAGTHQVVVFEKGRGVGGRMATRFAEGFAFDHGAQYFTIRDERFAQLLAPLLAKGTVAQWRGGIAQIADGRVTGVAEGRDVHYVGVPNMNSLPKALVEGLEVRAGVEVAPLGDRGAAGWALRDTAGAELGVFDWVISTTTAHQTLALFGPHAPPDGPLRTARMAPCYALMLGFAQDLGLEWSAARVKDSPVEWIGVNSSKPGRSAGGTSLSVHSSSEWAAAHLGQEPQKLGALLSEALLAATGIDAAEAAFSAVHRWASARRLPQEDSAPHVDLALGLAATGDWTRGSRVEDAALGGLIVANMLNGS